jgi:hypothetical protein
LTALTPGEDGKARRDVEEAGMTGQEDRHIELMDKLDFEAWNGPDWQLFRQLHTDDVTAELMGQRT